MPSTIRDLTELIAVAVDDYLLISDTSDVVNRDKRISRANLLGGSLMGGGVVATGGFTLTVPATGTAGLLGTAQSYSALKTFAAGLAFGGAPQSTLNYYEEGSWTPVLQFGGLSTGVVYAFQGGRYTRIGNVVYAWGRFTLTSKGTATGAFSIGGLPYPASNIASLLYPAVLYPSIMTFTDAIYGFVNVNSTQIYGAQVAGGTNTALADTHFTNNTQLGFSAHYRIG